MGKHDRAAQEKRDRNLRHAMTYRQRRCLRCGHRSAFEGRCKVCGGDMKKGKEQ